MTIPQPAGRWAGLSVPDELLALDACDVLAHKRAEFILPEDVIYLDGNSLGALPRSVPARIARVVTQEWGEQLIRSWSAGAPSGLDWMSLPDRVSAKLARLVGAKPHEIAVGDSTSVNLFKALAAALALTDRPVVLTDTDNFPSDLYVAHGLRALMPDLEVRQLPAADVGAHLAADVGVLLLTEVDYRTGARLDMAALNARARDLGVLTVWDLAHSAGAFPVDLGGCGADFAVGCGYKFLNGGPGAPAFLYVAERHHADAPVVLSGWMGHADPFEMTRDYVPAVGARRFLAGTPQVLSLSALDSALDVFMDVDMTLVRAKSVSLSRTLIQLMEPLTTRYPLTLASPADETSRGSQVSYRHPEARAVMAALIGAGVVGDFRTPDILRFGLTPLYQSHADIWKAVRGIETVLGAHA